ncbi:hypothetical protein FACS1894153_2950 [Bacteroidia bacterium]|nr:hypothetical protein FACS1894153_2950 [Bacteroidia bacterium]
MKKLITYIITGFAIFATSCTQDWNEKNFSNWTDHPVYNAKGEKELIVDDATIAAIAKQWKTDARTLAPVDSLVLVKNAVSLENSKMFATPEDLQENLPAQLKTLLAAGKAYQYMEAGSEFIVSYLIYSDPDAVSVATKDTLQTADYDAMGTATGFPGRYDNFDATMGYMTYLKTFLANKYSYTKEGGKVALSYKFYLGSGANGTPVCTTIFVKTVNGWEPVYRQDRFVVTADYNCEYKNTLILSEPFLTSLGQFSAYNLEGAETWVWNATYKCAYCTEYTSSTNHAGDDWLVSPTLDLSAREVCKLSFDYAHNYAKAGRVLDEFSVWVSDTHVDGSALNPSQWTKLTLPNPSTGSNFTFMKNVIMLNDYCGKPNVHIAFRYWSDDEKAGTSEIQNVLLEAVAE